MVHHADYFSAWQKVVGTKDNMIPHRSCNFGAQLKGVHFKVSK